MRTMLSVAGLLVLSGCAIIVVPEDGSVRYEGAFSSSAIQGNGATAVENRPVAALSALDVSGPLRVEVRVGAAPSLRVEGDSNLLPLVRSDSSSGALRLWVDGKISGSDMPRVIYTTPALSQLSASGSGRLAVSGLNGGSFSLDQNGSRSVELSGRVDRLDLRQSGSGSVQASALSSGSTKASLTGSGRLDLGQARGDSLELDVHGSGSARASGAVRSATVRLYGSGSAELNGLRAERAQLRSHGSGSISITASDSVEADANGSGRITIYGRPAQRSLNGQRIVVLD